MAARCGPAAVVGVGVLLVLGLVVAVPRPYGDQEPPEVEMRPTSQPRQVIAGVPVGYGHDAAGALSAAANFVVALGSPLTLDPARRPSTLAVLSAVEVDPGIATRFADRPAIEAQSGLLADLRAAAPVVARVAPVGARVLVLTDTRATVEVWAVAVVGTTRLGRLDMSWSTETLQLAWEQRTGGGDWKLLGYDSASGPVPALHQPMSSLAQALAATDGMSGFRYAATG